MDTAIKSVLNQSIGFRNIELILVDDNSTDNSKTIISKYCEKYENIIPIFLDKNSGHSAIPKNKGIEKSTGDYIMFFDPDDYLLEDICEVLYDKIRKEKCEFVSANAIIMKNRVPYYDIDYDMPEEIIHPTKYYKDYRDFRCWATLYEREFILRNDIRFINTIINEDTYFTHKCFYNAKKICFLNDHYGMIYFDRNNRTLSKTYTKETMMSQIYAFAQIKELLNSMNIIMEEAPFLIYLMDRLFTKWEVSIKDEGEIYDSLLDYKNGDKLPDYAAKHILLAEKLLDKRRFTLLHYYRSMIGTALNLNFIQKKLYSKRQAVEENDPLYESVSAFRNY